MIRECSRSADEGQWESDRGLLVIRRPAPLICVFVEQGYLEEGFTPLILEGLERSLRRGGKPVLFVDAEKLEGYDPSVRRECTKWFGEHKHEVVAQHMLVRSRIAKMGLSVASLILGTVIVGHHERVSFDAALKQALDACRSGRPPRLDESSAA